MRLIDADMLKAEWGFGDKCDECEADTRQCQYEPIYTKMDICDMIDDAPTVETKETVGHCKDCIYFKQDNSPAYGCGECSLLERRFIGDTDYCCYHARKATEADGNMH